MKILLDTNFILTCVKQKIYFDSFAEEIIDTNIEWILPQQVLNELGYLKDLTGMRTEDKEAAKISFEILQRLNPEIIDLGKNPNVDMAIVNYISGKEIILATLDKGLKNRTGNRILTIRAGKKLEIV